MYEQYSILISIIALVFSAFNLILYSRHIRRTTGAAIKHELTNLPPYNSVDSVTTIKVKNVGNAIANVEGTYLEFSWDKDLSIDLDYECEGEYFLVPNEDKIFHKKLPDPPSGSHIIGIVTSYDGLERKDAFPIQVVKGAVIVG